jgi:hypothetical protein
MQKIFAQALALVLVVTFLGTTASQAAPKHHRVHGDFKGKVTFSPTNITSGSYTVKVEADGSLSGLGRCHVVWEGLVSLDANLQATAGPGLGWKFTQPNGSTLQGTIQWQASSSTNQPGIYLATGLLQSTQGTGKLEGATGQGTILAHINALKGKATLHLDGFVNLPRRKG